MSNPKCCGVISRWVENVPGKGYFYCGECGNEPFDPMLIKLEEKYLVDELLLPSMELAGFSSWLPTTGRIDTSCSESDDMEDSDESELDVDTMAMVTSVNRSTGQVIMKLRDSADHRMLEVGMVLDLKREK